MVERANCRTNASLSLGLKQFVQTIRTACGPTASPCWDDARLDWSEVTIQPRKYLLGHRTPWKHHVARVEHNVAFLVRIRSDALEQRFGNGFEGIHKIVLAREQERRHRDVAGVIQRVGIGKAGHPAHAS